MYGKQATSDAAGSSTATATTVATVITAATVNYDTVDAQYSTIGAHKTEELIFDNPIYGASNVTAHTATKQPQTSAMAYDVLNLPQYDDPNALQVLPPAEEVDGARYEVAEVEPAVKDSIP